MVFDRYQYLFNLTDACWLWKCSFICIRMSRLSINELEKIGVLA